MNIRTSLLALALVSAAACFTPAAFAQDQSTSQGAQQAPQEQPQPAPQPADQDSHEDHQQIRNDAHEAGEHVRHGASEVGESIHRTAHWRRYHVCRRYWHHHCTRWSRRYRH